MKTIPLGEVAEIVSGATPKTSNEDYWGGEILWVTPADLSKLDGAYISSTPRTITEAGLRSCAATGLPAGSVLLSSRAPIGHVAINTEPMATNQGFKSLIPRTDRTDAKYLYHWLRANTEYLQSLGNGATFKEVSKAVVSKVEIPLPPLDEQRRIAATLDHADGLHTRSAKRLGYLEELAQSAFAELGTVVRSARQSRLGDIIEVRSSLVDPKKAEYQDFPHIGPDSIKSGGSRIEGWRTVAEDRVTSGKYSFRTGDILYSKIRPNLNKVAVARFDGLCSADMYAIKAMENGATPEFIEFSLRSPRFLSYADGLSNRANIPKLNRNQLEAFPVVVPGLEEQRQFAERLGAIRRCAGEVELAITRSLALIASLQSLAFAGQL